MHGNDLPVRSWPIDLTGLILRLPLWPVCQAALVAAAAASGSAARWPCFPSSTVAASAAARGRLPCLQEQGWQKQEGITACIVYLA